MKQSWKPGNMLYPLPAVMVSCQYPAGKADPECKNPKLQGRPNIITVAWAGTVCTNPPMLSISVRPERYSYHMLKDAGEFVVNLTTEQLAFATDYCGVRSGRDVDKFKEMHLTPLPLRSVAVPGIAESPVNIACKIREIKPLGSHHMILADVTEVIVDDTYMDENGKFDLNAAGLITYSHGEYFLLGQKLGTFGYSVAKKKTTGKAERKQTNRRAK
jgi:flavin reductase (DIM6/NTAB) family NADH-FMN oxidoreductase RutF